MYDESGSIESGIVFQYPSWTIQSDIEFANAGVQNTVRARGVKWSYRTPTPKRDPPPRRVIELDIILPNH